METVDGAGGGALALPDEELDALSFGWRPEFDVGDPRRPPFLAEALAKAEAAIHAPRRWHAQNGTDWLAMQLAYGRGVHLEEIERRFAVSQSALNKRKRKEGWTNLMLEGARRELALHVWHAGFRGGGPETEAERAHLLWSSEWRRVVKAPAWTPDASWTVADPQLRARAGGERGGGRGGVGEAMDEGKIGDGGCGRDERDVERERARDRDRAEVDRAIAALEQLVERVERQIADEQVRGNPDVDRAAEGGEGVGDA